MDRAAQRLYNTLFPYHAEVCTLTQYNLKGTPPGGWGGHATMFLNGAEIDPLAEFPRLRLVPEGTDLSGPDSGTGISVNRIFTNVAWVAIPGRDEFFHGGLAPDRALDRDVYRAAIEKATAARWFAGIQILPGVMSQKPATMPADEFVVRRSIGTDFALSFARSAYSARLPMTRTGIGKVVGYLNGLNESARRSGYVWNFYTDNCSHVTHNALAAAGIWDPKTARGPGTIDVLRDVMSLAGSVALGRLSDFSFPANTVVRLWEAGNERPIDDAVAAFRNRDIRRTIGDGWLVTGPGAIVARYPMHDAGRNQLFAPGRDPFLFSLPLLWDKRATFARIARDPAPILADVRANLLWFRDRYARTLANRPSGGELAGRTPDTETDPPFTAFRDRFYELIAKDLRATEARIADYERSFTR